MTPLNPNEAQPQVVDRAPGTVEGRPYQVEVGFEYRILPDPTWYPIEPAMYPPGGQTLEGPVSSSVEVSRTGTATEIYVRVQHRNGEYRNGILSTGATLDRVSVRNITNTPHYQGQPEAPAQDSYQPAQRGSPPPTTAIQPYNPPRPGSLASPRQAPATSPSLQPTPAITPYSPGPYPAPVPETIPIFPRPITRPRPLSRPAAQSRPALTGVPNPLLLPVPVIFPVPQTQTQTDPQRVPPGPVITVDLDLCNDPCFQEMQNNMRDCCAEILARIDRLERYVRNRFDSQQTLELEIPLCSDGQNRPQRYFQNAPAHEFWTLSAQLLMQAQNIQFMERCDFPAVAAVPEWWQVRTPHTPQAVITLADLDPTSATGYGKSRWTFSIPHYKHNSTYDLRLEFTKGQYFGILKLIDNSQVWINADTLDNAETLCLIIAELIQPEYLTTPLQIHTGKRGGQPLSTKEVRAIRIAYFPNGQENLEPEWLKDLR